MMMSDLLLRLGILAAVAGLTLLGVRLVRVYVAAQRRQALAAPASAFGNVAPLPDDLPSAPVRILAFSSDVCRQCHTLQAPALRRLAAARPEAVAIRELDAPSHSALAERFRILTLPSTVLLDAAGHPLAINYGFANTEKLLAQVDGALAPASAFAR
ncbi:MAG TPA: hypothetical protein VFU88_02240 [Ktedonobacterales bacterium]|nr:hypothetical protein [Ktedonobacterales bacterium]